MSGIINIIIGALILFLVVLAFLWVSAKHKESGLGDSCSGNCSSCRAHCKDEAGDNTNIKAADKSEK